MQNAIKNEIKKLGRRILVRDQAIAKQEAEYRARFEKRSGLIAGIPAPKSTTYLSPLFDAKYCMRNANGLSKNIWSSVLNASYEPIPALNFLIPKPNGSKRSLYKFSIPDAALANVVMRRTQIRNIKRLSPYSFAYHPQKNLFDAVLSLTSFIDDEKIFCVQVDFKDYFDSIPTKHMVKCLEDRSLLSTTPQERLVLDKLMKHRYASRDNYTAGKFDRRHKGTPQGSSASLLLANLANHHLDSDLERKSGRFVRYADDVLALCQNYDQAQSIESAFVTHCKQSGLVINKKKTPGIAILNDKEAEMRTATHFDYLGYRFTKEGLTLPDSVTSRIKSKISHLIYVYLISSPLKYGFSPNRAGVSPDFDWDFLGLISEIRKYLYGGLDEGDISDFIKSGKKPKAMRGLMGFYCLVDSSEKLEQLDGWLINCLERAMKKRRLLLAKYGAKGITPKSVDIIKGTWLNKSAWRGTSYPELTAPSFVRGWRAARKYYFTYGLANVEPPKYFSYY